MEKSKGEIITENNNERRSHISAGPPCSSQFWDNTLWARSRKGSGGGAPRTPENFRKFAKNFLRKLQKWIILLFSEILKP